MTRLCPHLGCTLAETRDMPESELALWEALDERIEPIGPARFDALAALLAVVIHRAAGSDKLRFEDCFLWRDAPAEQSDEEMQAALAAAVRSARK